MHRTFSRPAGGLLHRPFTVDLSARLFSVALSIAQDHPAPSALDKRILCPAESGLSSVLSNSDRSLARRFRGDVKEPAQPQAR